MSTWKTLTIAALSSVFLTANVCAQQAGDSPAQRRDLATFSNIKQAAQLKRHECAERARQQKLRGTERMYAVLICMAEARLDCLKKAASQKVARANLKTFTETCLANHSSSPQAPQGARQ